MSRHVMPLPLSQKPTLEIAATALDIELEPVEANEEPFAEVHGAALPPGALKLEPGGEVTKLELGMPWRNGFEWGFPHRLVLHVPAHVRVRLTADAGRIHAERLAGCDLDITSHASAVSLENVRGRIKVTVDSGSVKGEHVGGTLDVRSVAGSVRLGIDALDAGKHQVRTAMGSVRVDLAAGLQVELDTATTLGSVRARYPSTRGAPAVLKLEAELGSVKVREVDAAEPDERHGDWPDWRRLWRDVAGAVVSSVVNDVTGEGRRAEPRPPSSPPQREELRRVLELVQQGKISTEEAERLISAMS